MNSPYLNNRELKNHLETAHSVIFALSKARACKLAAGKALVLDICVGNSSKRTDNISPIL